MAVDLKPWDAAEILTDEASITAYLEEVFTEGDPSLIARAIGDVARARHVSAIAREANVSRDTLYAAFGPGGNPTLATFLAVTKALGFALALKPLPSPASVLPRS